MPVLVVLVSLYTCYVYGNILVIGSSGRLGRVVVSNLLARGVPTVSFVRDQGKASGIAELQGSKIVQGDITDLNSLEKAISENDIEKVIDVHGCRPPRFIKLGDLFRSPRENDYTHPYNVNYRGTQNLLAAMKANNVKKLVRLTGALVGASAFKPFVALFNFLLSFSNMWHERSELLIRESGIDYTVVRPSELVDEPSCAEQTYPVIGAQAVPHYLVAASGDSAKDSVPPIPVPSKISIRDVADLCVQAACVRRYGSGSRSDTVLSKSTVIVCSQQGKGPRSFDELMCYDHAGDTQYRDDPEKNVLVAGRHRLATVVYGAAFTTFLALALQVAGAMLRFLGATGKRAITVKIG